MGICMLLPALLVIAQPLPGLGAERGEDRLSSPGLERVGKAAKIKKKKKTASKKPDQYLRAEFGDMTLHIEPAATVRGSSRQAGSQALAAQEPPLHGYGTFEGVVLVPPSDGGSGMVLVEPAAQTEPVMETAGEAQIPDDEVQIPEDLREEQADPFEPVNRFFFGLNEVLDHLILEPAARVYHVALPEPVRQGVSNAVRNLGSPVILANDILQGTRQGASDTIVRFMVNSVIVIGGLVDAAGYMGVQYHSEDFGQTLAVWGVGPGPYMVLPVFGPSNPRDAVGIVVDTALNPLTWILFDAPVEERFAPSAIELLVGREAILEDYANLRKTSPDLYVSVRDIYGEKRQTEISNGDVTGETIPGATSLPPTSVMTPFRPF
jgi:phospholipid-binding lipoprotein MlaA